MLTTGTDIYDLLNKKNRKCVNPTDFTETVALFICDKKKAMKKAKRHADGLDKLSISRDRSRLDTRRT